MSAPTKDPVIWTEAAGSNRLADLLSNVVAGKLQDAVRLRNRALLVLSGGTTPLPFFKALSEKDIEWEKVTVTLADERFVPPDSPRSNQRLVAMGLLQNKAAKAHFESLHENEKSVIDAAVAADARLANIGFPADVCVLGMGLDGHTASLFPDWEDLSTGLDPANDLRVMAVETATTDEPRLTMPLARLVQSRSVILLIEGYEKKEYLTEVLRNLDTNMTPIATVIRAARRPVEIFWAPKTQTKTKN